MASCHRNDIGSIVPDRLSTTITAANRFRLWLAFSGAAFRRKIFDATSCGGSSRHHHLLMQELLNDTVPQPPPPPTATKKSVLKESNEPKKPNNNGKSEKLADLLNLAERETDAETKHKVEALEELKGMVKELQVEEEEKKRKAANSVRLLTKEDLEAREQSSHC